MLPIVRLGVAFLLVSLALSSRATAAQRNDPAALCARHESQIRKLVAAGHPADVIVDAAQYELDLRSSYPPPVLASGAFISATQHVSFGVPRDVQWKLVDRSGAISTGAATGVELIGTIESGSEEGRLDYVFLDLDVMARHTGLDIGGTAEEFRKLARQTAGSWGRVENERSEKIRGMDVLRLQVAGEAVSATAAVRHGRRIYFVACSTPHDAPAGQADKWIDQCLANMKFFDPTPATAAKIAGIRAAIPNPPTVDALLASVRELAKLGEFHEAIVQAADLRGALMALLPKPQIDAQGNVSYADYGVTLQNPDAKIWKPDAQPAGNAVTLSLTNDQSVDPAMVGVVVFDPLLMLGPIALDYVGPTANENAARDLLRNMGRGGALKLGSKLEGERFRRFRGQLAYETTVNTRYPNTKMKVIAIRGRRAVYMVMLLGRPQKLPDYETSLDRVLQLQPSALNPAATPPAK
jgi:hypothetical protein